MAAGGKVEVSIIEVVAGLALHRAVEWLASNGIHLSPERVVALRDDLDALFARHVVVNAKTLEVDDQRSDAPEPGGW